MLKTLPVLVMTREAALSVIAEKLYDNAVTRVGTENVRITIQPGRVLDSGFYAERAEFTLPRINVSVGSTVSPDYEEIQIRIHYSEGDTPIESEKLGTLEQFVNVTLAKWESFLSHIDVKTEQGKKAESDLLNAMDVLKRTYSLDELFQGQFSPEDFKAYFNVIEGSHHD